MARMEKELQDTKAELSRLESHHNVALSKVKELKRKRSSNKMEISVSSALVFDLHGQPKARPRISTRVDCRRGNSLDFLDSVRPATTDFVSYPTPRSSQNWLVSSTILNQFTGFSDTKGF